jgi:hypothetical protein
VDLTARLSLEPAVVVLVFLLGEGGVVGAAKGGDQMRNFPSAITCSSSNQTSK